MGDVNIAASYFFQLFHCGLGSRICSSADAESYQRFFKIQAKSSALEHIAFEMIKRLNDAFRQQIK